MSPKFNSNLELQRVSGVDSAEFTACLAILHEAIPPSEQLSDPKLTKLLARDDYHLYALMLDATVAATAILYTPKSEPFVLLDYMAVRADLRRCGLGSRFFTKLVQQAISNRPEAGFLLFEVDDDRMPASLADNRAARRIEFYHRLGARLLANVDYRFPVSGGLEVTMRLMVYRLRHDRNLSPQLLGAAIANIFREVHGRGADDRLLQSILQKLPRRLIMK
jgi:GNAT superfamily N-acetyltransferase